MGDAENAVPSSKKRAAGREISRDNPGLDDDDDSAEQETGTFKRASDEVLSTRRIVKVRRNQTTSTPSSNPFAGIRLVPSAESTAATVVPTAEVVATSDKVPEEGKSDVSEDVEKGRDEKSEQSEIKIDKPGSEIATDKESAEDKEKSKETENKTDEPVVETVADEESAEGKESSSIVNEAAEPQVDNERPAEDETEKEKDAVGGGTENQDEKDSDKKDNGSEAEDPSTEGTPLNSFQQLSSSKNAFTGLAGTGFSTTTFSFGSAPKDGSALGSGSGSLFGLKNEQSSFGFGINGSSSISSIVSKTEGSGFPSMQEVPVETGEENERVVFSADSALFEFLDGSWKERGKGELKVNVSTTGTERARLLMRARGNFRLILNTNLYADMKLTNMDKRGITFAAMNSVGGGKEGLSTFALKFKDGSIVEEFRSAVTTYQGKTSVALKTPENSPKASDE